MTLVDPSADDSTEQIERRHALWANLDARVSTVAGARNAADAELCELFAEVLDVGGWKMDGIRSENHWLTWQFGLSATRASQMLRMARRWHVLPHAVRRFRAGELSFEQMSIIARRCPTGFDDDVAEFAVSATLRQLEVSLRDYHFDADRDGDEPDDRESKAKNSVSRGFDDHGRYRLNADLDAATGAVVDASIDHARDLLRTTASDGAAADGSHDEAGLGTGTLSDALLLVCSRSIGADPSADRRRRTEPIVHIDVDGLIGTVHLGPTLTERMTALFLCDSAPSIVAELGGVPLAKGRSTEKIPSALRQLILHRDGGCRICGSTRNLHVHHIVHWAHGGPTDPENLVSLCHRHHVLVHQGTIDVEGDPTRPHDVSAFRVVDSRGRTLTPPRWHAPPDGNRQTKRLGSYQHPLGESFDESLLFFNPNAPPNPN